MMKIDIRKQKQKMILKSLKMLLLDKGTIDSRINVCLQGLGWAYTCNNPGSYWMFKRKLKTGEILMVNKEDAIRLTINNLEEL